MEKTPFKSVIIMGYGDIGQRVAQLWLAEGAAVYGLARSKVAEESLQAPGLVCLQADLDGPVKLNELPLADSLLYWFVPPPPRGQTDPRMQNLLTALDVAGKPARIVAISTSGIYGDQQGKLVCEDTPPNPQVDRARRRLDMERQLQSWGERHGGLPVITLRVGGIYGPNRLPLQRIRDGVPVLAEALAPKTNRIHADDLARVCLAAALKPTGSRIYNVSDGQEANMTEYFFTLADFFALPRPPVVDWAEAERTISPGMLSYLRESRRLDTRRMQQELGVALQYPSLLDGLQAMRQGKQ